jgi:hypothetical protein
VQLLRQRFGVVDVNDRLDDLATDLIYVTDALSWMGFAGALDVVKGKTRLAVPLSDYDNVSHFTGAMIIKNYGGVWGVEALKKMLVDRKVGVGLAVIPEFASDINPGPVPRVEASDIEWLKSVWIGAEDFRSAQAGKVGAVYRRRELFTYCNNVSDSGPSRMAPFCTLSSPASKNRSPVNE